MTSDLRVENILSIILSRHERFMARICRSTHGHLPQRESKRLAHDDPLRSCMPSSARCLRALERYGGVQTRAAAELGIGERVLRYKLQKHGLRAWLTEEGAEENV
jgi:DNA-binding NtrC family response regulator